MPWATLKHHGVVTDFPPEEVPADAWTDASNVRFDKGITRRMAGYQRYSDPPSGGPLFALNVLVDATSWWIYCTDSQVFATDGLAHYDITPAGGLSLTQANEWTGCVLNGIPVLNNIHDAPIYWTMDTGTPCAVLPGWPATARCRAIRAHKYHLFALSVMDGIQDLEATLWWSAAAPPGNVPTEWVPAVTNDAGDMPLSDTPGAIVDGLSLRDHFVVYKQASVYLLSYVAGQYVYTQRKLYLSDGIAGRNCVAEYQGDHYVITGSDVLAHDGQNAKSILYGKVQEKTLTSIKSERMERCFIALRRLTKQLYVGIPTNDSDLPNTLVAIDLVTGDCGLEQIPPTAHIARGMVRITTGSESWDGDTGTWGDDPSYWNEQDFNPTDDTLLACMPTLPALMALESGDLADGSAIAAAVERTGLQVHDGIERVLVTHIALRLQGEASETVTVRVGGQAVFGTPVKWSDPITVALGEPAVLPCMAEGRLIAVRLEGATRHPWHLHSYKLQYQVLGLY